MKDFKTRLNKIKEEWQKRNIKKTTENMRNGKLLDNDVQQYLAVLKDKGIKDSQPFCDEVSGYFEIMRLRLEPFDEKTTSAFNYGVIAGTTYMMNVLRSRQEELETFMALSETKKNILLYVQEKRSVCVKEIEEAIKNATYKSLKSLHDHGFLRVTKVGKKNYYSLTVRAGRCLEQYEKENK